MAFRLVFAQGDCPVCYTELSEGEAVAHSKGGETHPIHRPCLDIWAKAEKEKRHVLCCPVCRINVTSIETTSEALIRMSETGDLKSVQTLVASGVIQNHSEEAIFVASRKGYDQIVNVLLPNDSPYNPGCGSLQIASQNGHARIVEILLSNGREKRVSHAALRQCLALATANEYEDVIAILKLHLQIESQVPNPAGILELAQPSLQSVGCSRLEFQLGAAWFPRKQEESYWNGRTVTVFKSGSQWR